MAPSAAESARDDALQALIATTENSKSKSLPTATDFYRLGLVLSERSAAAYQAYLETIPLPHLASVIMMNLTSAFQSVLSASTSSQQGMDNDVYAASECMANLLLFSSTACQAAYSIQLCSCLALAYGAVENENADRNDLLPLRLQNALQALWTHGLLPKLKSTEGELALEHVMELVQSLTENDQNTFLGDSLTNEMVESIRTSLVDDTPQRDYVLNMMTSSSKATDFVARTGSDSVVASRLHEAPLPPHHRKVDPKDELQRRMQQVKDLLPDLGDGYIETALSCFGGDVNRAVSALFEGESNPASLPASLQFLDKSLPARRQETALSTTNYSLQDDEDARNVTKSRLKDMEQTEEMEAYALTVMRSSAKNEYDDDYDDQYDEMGIGEVGGDNGYDDVDLDTIKTYNRVTREAEREAAFWNESRNTNHRNNHTMKGGASGQDDDEKSFRGAKKIKGGRAVDENGKVIPRQRGGKKGRGDAGEQQQQQKQEPASTQDTNAGRGGRGGGRGLTGRGGRGLTGRGGRGLTGRGGDGPQQQQQQQANNTDCKSGGEETKELTKIQKRRKNDNKAKIGNHHRKDRALKKAVGGM